MTTENQAAEPAPKVFLSAEQILNFTGDMPVETVDCPEWGGSIRIAAVTGEEIDQWEARILTKPIAKGADKSEKLRNVRANLVSICAVDENGKKLFTADQIARLGKRSAKALRRCYDVAARLNGVTEEEAEELAKN